jgi:hypothetical protein
MERAVIVDFQSLVFLRRPQKIFEPKMATYLKVAGTEKYNYFVTMESGRIEVVRTKKSSQLMNELKPYNKYSLKHAAHIYLTSTLEKSEKAERMLKAILRNKDLTRTNFLEGPDKDRIEKPTKTERLTEKANEVTLEQICQDIRLDPKKVRALFREHNVPKPGNRWTWEKSNRDNVIKQIKSMMSLK